MPEVGIAQYLKVDGRVQVRACQAGLEGLEPHLQAEQVWLDDFLTLPVPD